MMMRFILRMIRETSPRLLWKFCWNFGWKGMRAVNRFKRRVERGEPFFPAFLFLSVTNNCNLQCQGCWVTPSQPAAELSVPDINRIVEESKKQGAYFFGILGGEPLLHNGLFDVFSAHPDCYFQLFTNGLLLTDEVARRLNKAGNVTPLISIEGLEDESDRRRGGRGVYQSAIQGLEACRRQRLITGVAASICRANFDELVNEDYARELCRRGVHYLWYYIYRPAGANPSPEMTLSEEQIVALRSFIVKLRGRVPMMIVDAYWDHEGRAQCPAATGISHHINPRGDIEPCPVIQFACDSIHDERPLAEVIAGSAFLNDARATLAATGRGCILMDNPRALEELVKRNGARDTTGRQTGIVELQALQPCPSHNIPGREQPETHPLYKAAKKRWFFGFGAYG